MPYNKNTALENKRAFLLSQSRCGFPAIEKRAKESLKKLEEHLKMEAEMNARIKAFNDKWSEQREKTRGDIK